MTQASNTRKAKKLAAKAKDLTEAISKPENGVLKLKVSDSLKYKLMAMSERLAKHEATKKEIEARIEHAILERNRVIAEITKANEDRLGDGYEMVHMSFDTNVATYESKLKVD